MSVRITNDTVRLGILPISIIQSLLFVLVLFAWPATALAQEPTPSDDDVNKIAKKLYCPVCENVPLDVCPTQACVQWRATIREKMIAGWDEQQILDYFAAQYGERVLAQPSTRGLNLFVWLIPPALLLAGAFVLWRFLHRMAAPPTPGREAAASPPAPPDEYARRLEQELAKRR